MVVVEVLPIVVPGLQAVVKVLAHDPLVDLVDDLLVDDGLELAREEGVAAEGGVDLLPVAGLEVVGAAAAPVDDGLVLALAALRPPPVGQVQVVADNGRAEARVPQHHVEERLGRECDILEVAPQPGDGLVGTRQGVLNKSAVEAKPLRAAVDLHAAGQLPGADEPHVVVTLDEGLVQPLLADKLARLTAMAAHEVPSLVGREEVHQLGGRLERVVRLGQVQHEVPAPVLQLQQLAHALQQHPELGGPAPDGDKAVADHAHAAWEESLQPAQLTVHVVLPGVNVDQQVVVLVEDHFDQPQHLPDRPAIHRQQIDQLGRHLLCGRRPLLVRRRWLRPERDQPGLVDVHGEVPAALLGGVARAGVVALGLRGGLTGVVGHIVAAETLDGVLHARVAETRL
mmetsp:Transcript_92567/g.257848  ORF Transcript_92567/g.257848 Transcript_92567/m.257848 type:complete len:398 (-) Transcript_92567:735-1928(-)